VDSDLFNLSVPGIQDEKSISPTFDFNIRQPKHEESLIVTDEMSKPTVPMDVTELLQEADRNISVLADDEDVAAERPQLMDISDNLREQGKRANIVENEIETFDKPNYSYDQKIVSVSREGSFNLPSDLLTTVRERQQRGKSKSVTVGDSSKSESPSLVSSAEKSLSVASAGDKLQLKMDSSKEKQRALPDSGNFRSQDKSEQVLAKSSRRQSAKTQQSSSVTETMSVTVKKSKEKIEKKKQTKPEREPTIQHPSQGASAQSDILKGKEMETDVDLLEFTADEAKEKTEKSVEEAQDPKVVDTHFAEPVAAENVKIKEREESNISVIEEKPSRLPAANIERKGNGN